RFTRAGAIPKSVLWSLQAEGSVATLDAERRRQRKALFMSLMTPEKIEALARLTENKWLESARLWEQRTQVNLHGEIQKILCSAVCEWAGIQLCDTEVAERTREFAAMIDGAGSVGPRNWRGL